VEFSGSEKILVVLVILLAVTTGASFYIGDIKALFGKTVVVAPDGPNVAIVSSAPVLPTLPDQRSAPLANPPEIIKAVYVTSYSAGSAKYLEYLSNLFRNTEINAVVIDIKDSSGSVSYKTGAIKDIDVLIKFFHDQNVYVIGRIAVFEDPLYSKARPDIAIHYIEKTGAATLTAPVLWKDSNGLSWLDPASKDAWDYNISLAKDAFYHGFDEINFDYVRFPSDGKIENMDFPVWDGKTPKAEIIKEFFQYVRANLLGKKISVDLFGQTTTSVGDMGIGQIIENAFENFDYVSPMVYPSHYTSGFMGFANPADHPYEIVNYSMGVALNREEAFLKKKIPEAVQPAQDLATGGPSVFLPAVQAVPILAKFRPWIQDFNMGANYTADMVKAEITATQDALGEDYRGFMLWNPSNIYTASAVQRPN